MERLICLVCAIFLVSCASPESRETTYYFPDFDSGSTADGAAYAADSMHFNKPMTQRPVYYRPEDYYFKHCTQIGEGSYFSKTSYECTAP